MPVRYRNPHRLRDVLSQELTFTSREALEPRVIKFCVTGKSALVEPGTTAGATTWVSGFVVSAAHGTPFAR